MHLKETTEETKARWAKEKEEGYDYLTHLFGKKRADTKKEMYESISTRRHPRKDSVGKDCR